jgi:hypothetical protein
MLLLPCKGTTWSREEGELRKLRERINIRHNIRRRQCWQWGSAAAGWRNDSGCPYEYFPSRLWSFGASDVGLREGEGQSWRRCLLRRVLLLFGSNYTQPLKSTQESVLNHHFYSQKRFPPPRTRFPTFEVGKLVRGRGNFNCTEIHRSSVKEVRRNFFVNRHPACTVRLTPIYNPRIEAKFT